MTTTSAIIGENEQQEYYFGPQGFHLLASQAQVDEATKALAELHSEPLPEHTSSWKVIGQDTELGDPYFIDEADFTGAVYTTVPGNWLKILVATSVANFLESLALLDDASGQQQAIFLPDETCITDDKVLTELALLIGNLSGGKNFWQEFFAGYHAWLHDDGEGEYDGEGEDEVDLDYPAE